MNPVLDSLRRAWPVDEWSEVTVVVAVSGGADSVALLRAVRQLLPATAAGRIVAAHYNHALRPESDDDEAFVAELAQRLEIPLQAERAAEGLREQTARMGLEAAAREARYDFLQRVVARTGARYLATGHTADDQAETVLHRILRGAGLQGLVGIPARRAIHEGVVLVRPLLEVNRPEILAFLRALGQGFQIDPSNENPAFTRNRVRRQLLPMLRESFNPQVDQALCRLASLAGQAQQVIDFQTERLWDQAARRDGDDLCIDLAALNRSPEYLVAELLRRCWSEQRWPLRSMSYAHWSQLVEMTRGEGPTSQDFPGSIRAQRDADRLRLSCIEQPS